MISIFFLFSFRSERMMVSFFFQAENGIRDADVTGVQTCALPILGPVGAGHSVKMVHNGIEYGPLQAYAEGYEILHASKLFPSLDLEQVSAVWQNGSVVRSW